MGSKTTTVIKQTETAPVEVEVLAESIVSISEGVKRLRSSSLKDNTLFLLIQHAAPAVRGRKPTISEIAAIFDGIEGLRRAHLKPATVNGSKKR